MRPTPFAARLSLGLALALSTASLIAFAGEPVDRTEIEVFANGKSEKVSIADLKIGETRQLYSDTGTLVTATRLADSLELDIAGDRTSVPMLGQHELTDADIDAIVAGDDGASADGKTRIVRIHHADHATGADGEKHRVIALDAGSDASSKVIVRHGGDGKQVIVKRHVTQDGQD